MPCQRITRCWFGAGPDSVGQAWMSQYAWELTFKDQTTDGQHLNVKGSAVMIGRETMMNITTMENRIKRLESFFGTNNATVRTLRAQVSARKGDSEPGRKKTTKLARDYLRARWLANYISARSSASANRVSVSLRDPVSGTLARAGCALRTIMRSARSFRDEPGGVTQFNDQLVGTVRFPCARIWPHWKHMGVYCESRKSIRMHTKPRH